MILKKLLCAVALLGLVPSTQAKAESFLFSIQSEYAYIVHLAFYSDDRDWVWPSGDEVYVLDDSKVHDYSLTCQYGEKICYGAWPKGSRKTFWGVGLDGDNSCQNCCYTCTGGESGVIVLQD